MAPLILALDQQLPSFKSQQTPPFPLNMYQIHPSRHAGPKHFQANLCSFPTNVDNSQHFHFIMAQKDMPSGQKDTLRYSAAQLDVCLARKSCVWRSGHISKYYYANFIIFI